MTEQNSTQKLVDIESKTIGASVPAAVVLPPGFDPEGEPLPLFIELHGLGGDRTELGRAFGRWIDEMFRAGTLCPAVLVSCSSEPGGFYAGAWERFFAEELPEWMAKNFGTRSDREGVVLAGLSMGGYGTLKIGFKHPDRFAAIAGWMPAGDPSFEWLPDITNCPPARDYGQFQGPTELFEAAWGSPFDPEKWMADNPANVVRDNAEAIRSSGLEIYLECGDKDDGGLHSNTEFLHRVLWDHDIRHEYHLVRGAYHGGVSLKRRFYESHAFLVAALRSELEEPLDLPLTGSEKAYVAWMVEGAAKGEPAPDEIWEWGVDHARDPSIQEHMFEGLRKTGVDLNLRQDPKRAYMKLPPSS